MSQVLETKAEPTAEPKTSDRATPHWFNLAAAVSGFIGVLVGLAAFWSAQSIGQARLQQDAVTSTNTRLGEQDRLRLEYVRIAVAILKPAKPTEPQKELRSWAVEVLNKSADIKLSAEQAQALIDGTSTLSSYGWDSYGREGADYSGYELDAVLRLPRSQPSATANPNS